MCDFVSYLPGSATFPALRVTPGPTFGSLRRRPTADSLSRISRRDSSAGPPEVLPRHERGSKFSSSGVLHAKLEKGINDMARQTDQFMHEGLDTCVQDLPILWQT